MTGKTVVVPDGDKKLRLKTIPDTAKYQDPMWGYIGRNMRNNRLFSQFYNNPEGQRILLFSDYNMMERDPIIARALSLISEETCLPDENDEVIHIHTDNEMIRVTLEHLFYEILKVDFSLQSWVRQMLKYGDCFIYLNLQEKVGVTDAIVLPSSDVERIEEDDRTIFKAMAIFSTDIPEERMLHFRNIGNTDFLPYGLCLNQNTRIKTLNGFKEIKDIEVGESIYSFDETTEEFVPSTVLDKVLSGSKKTLKISTVHNFVEASEEHRIMIYDPTEDQFVYHHASELKKGDLLVINKRVETGEQIPINKTLEEFNKNGFWNTSKNIPDFVDEEFARLFGFLLGDGWITQDRVYFACSPYEDRNAMYSSLLSKFSGCEVINRDDERSILQHSQTSVGSKMLSTILYRMGFIDGAHNKRIPEWAFRAAPDIKRAFIKGLMDADGSINVDEWNCTRYSIELCNYELVYDLKTLLNSLNIKSGKIGKRNNRTGRENNIGGVQTVCGVGYTLYFYESERNQKKKYQKLDKKTDQYITEPIASIEMGEEEVPVYDIYVDNQFHNFVANDIVVHNSHLEPVRRHWRMMTLLEDFMMVYYLLRSVNQRVFYMDMGILPNTSIDTYINMMRDMYRREPIINPKTGEYDLYYDPMTLIEDIIVPTREGYDNMRVDEIPASPETNITEGLNLLRQKIMAGLGVPNFLLNYEEQLNSRATASSEDVRMAKFVESIQKIMISELEKVAFIHLLLLGFDKKELFNFSLSLTPPSNLHEMEKLELLDKRTETASSLKDSGFFSNDWIWENIFGLTEGEIETMKAQILQDKLDEKMTEDQISNFEFNVEEELPEDGGGDFGTPDAGEGSQGGQVEPNTGLDDTQLGAPEVEASDLIGDGNDRETPTENPERRLNDEEDRDPDS